jgi:hypothetical protein
LGFAKKHTEKQPKQIEVRFVSVRTEKQVNCFEDTLIESVVWRFIRFVSVVSIPVRNTETNRNKPKQTETNQNKPKKFFWGFAKQTEKQPKQIEFRFVSVRTEKKI